jgi:hypothetical protein
MQCKKCSKMFTPRAGRRLNPICPECGIDPQNNVDPKNIDISKGQAKILKEIIKSISHKKLSKYSLNNTLRDNTERIYQVHDNWGTKEHFIDLVLNYKNPNQISLIMYFLSLKNEIGKTPTKKIMEEISKFKLNEYEKKFESWEKFLDLLGFDPWYRNNTKPNVITRSKPRKTRNAKEIKSNLVSRFTKDDSIQQIVQKTNYLREEIQSALEKKDLEEDYSDYSYVEMFNLLEKYIKIIPNSQKYLDLKSYFWS